MRNSFFAMAALLAVACSADTSTEPTPVPAGDTLGAVTQLAAVPATDPTPQVSLTWSYDGADPQGYQVYRAAKAADLDAVGTAEAATQPVGKASSLEFVDRSVTFGQTYFYRVVAYDGTTFGTPSAVVSAKIPAEDVPEEPLPPPPPPPPPPPGPTPYVYTGLPGTLPASACASGAAAYSISAAAPAVANVLPMGTPVTFTVTVSYANPASHTVQLRAVNQFGTQIARTPNAEQKYTANTTGCGTVAVSLANVTTSSITRIAVSLVIDGNAVNAPQIVYQVGAASPYFRLAALMASNRTSLQVGPDGRLDLDAKWAYGNLPASWVGFVQTWAPNETFDYFYWVPPTYPTGTFTWNARPRPYDCSSTSLTLYNEIYNADGSENVETYLDFPVELPALLVQLSDNVVVSPNAGPATQTINVLNCSAKTQYVTVTTNRAWWYPQAASTAIAPLGSAAVTYAVDATGQTAGIVSGVVTLAPADVTANTLVLPVKVAVPRAVAYTATPTTYAWYADAATGTGTLVSGTSYTDEGVFSFNLPFAHKFYGVSFTKMSAYTNGYAAFGDPQPSYYYGSMLPGTQAFFTILLGWGDLELDPAAGGTVYTKTLGTAPNRTFIVTWYKAAAYGSGTNPGTYQIVLTEGSDDILIQYGTATGGFGRGTNLGDGVIYTTWSATSGTAYVLHQP